MRLSEENKVCLCAMLTDPFTNPTNQTHHNVSLSGTSHRPTQLTVPSHVGTNPSAHSILPPRAGFSAGPLLHGLESVHRAQPAAAAPCTLGLALWRRLTHVAQMFPVTESPGNGCVKTHALSKACLECDQTVRSYCLITGQLETQPCFLLSELLGLASLMGHDSNSCGCSKGFL